MSKHGKGLPRPKGSRFSPAHRCAEHAGEGGLADRIAAAAAAGKLDSFLEEEFPDNEGAKNLVAMMAGLTGMPIAPGPQQPSDVSSSPADREPAGKRSDPGGDAQASSPSPPDGDAVPEAVFTAAAAGDVAALKGLLAEEYRKRSGAGDKTPAEPAAETPENRPATDERAFDKETLDELLQIARDQNVSLDWLLSRALTLYVRDYRSTGRL